MSAPVMTVMVVECQTCNAVALWAKQTDGTAWAVDHSRSTGHPDNYRAKALNPKAIRGRVWLDMDDGQWHWRVQQPGLTVGWGNAPTLVQAQASCDKTVGIYRRLPVKWTDEPDGPSDGSIGHWTDAHGGGR